MRSGTQRLPVERGDLLPMSPIAESVAHRAEQVVVLGLKRRKMALAYKRTHREDQRIALQQLDNHEANDNIISGNPESGSGQRWKHPWLSVPPRGYRARDFDARRGDGRNLLADPARVHGPMRGGVQTVSGEP